MCRPTAPGLPRPGRAACLDQVGHEGSCTVWMFVEPLGCWRDVRVTRRRTALEWAEQIRALVDAPRVEEGLEAALGRRQRSRERAPVLDGEGQARLVAIACSEPPEGRARWTLHLLADELKRRQIVHTISHETVRKVLKKLVLV